MKKPIKILLQATIPTSEDDWDIARFSMLRDYLASCKDDDGNNLFCVTARNREADADENEPVLSSLDSSDFDELWLFAADIGASLTEKDCEGISKFRASGGGILITRDHQDLGSCICSLGEVGAAHYFHTKNPDPDTSRCCRDDPYTTNIDCPNYHSGSNGDYQKITPVEPVHELLKNPNSPFNTIQFFASHPHEGGIGVPLNAKHAQVIVTGTSKITNRPFNLAIAFESIKDEHGNTLGRAIAESSFHHFVDYNWNTEMGCPSFVEEPPGNGIKKNPQALDDIKAYVRNVALWLKKLKD